MSEERKFPFAAIDPGGMPRTGIIKAESRQSAESKLRKKGFTAIDFSAGEQAKLELQVKTPKKGSQVGLATRRGYRTSWNDIAENGVPAASKVKPVAYVLLILGLLLTIVLWNPTEKKLPHRPSPSTHALELEVSAAVEAELELEGQKVVIDFPEIPYSWDGSLEENLDPKGRLKKQFAFSTTRKPGLVKLSILNAKSDKVQFSEERSLAEGQTSIDFGPLRIR